MWKELVTCVKIKCDGITETNLTEIPDGTAGTMVFTTTQYFTELLPFDKITSLTTGGAAVMVGEKSGVGFQLNWNDQYSLPKPSTWPGSYGNIQNVDELIKSDIKYFKYSGVMSHVFAEIHKIGHGKPIKNKAICNLLDGSLKNLLQSHMN